MWVSCKATALALESAGIAGLVIGAISKWQRKYPVPSVLDMAEPGTALIDRQTCGQHVLPSGCPALQSNEAGYEIPTVAKDLHTPRNARLLN